MTTLFQQAVEAVKQRPDAEQDMIARMILKDIEEDKRWQASFDASIDMLAAIAQEACDEDDAGRTWSLDERVKP